MESKKESQCISYCLGYLKWTWNNDSTGLYCIWSAENTQCKCHILFDGCSMQSVLMYCIGSNVSFSHIRSICSAGESTGRLFTLEMCYSNTQTHTDINKSTHMQIVRHPLSQRERTWTGTCMINRYKGKKTTYGSSCKEVMVAWRAGAQGLSVLLASGYTLQWTWEVCAWERGRLTGVLGRGKQVFTDKKMMERWKNGRDVRIDVWVHRLYYVAA